MQPCLQMQTKKNNPKLFNKTVSSTAINLWKLGWIVFIQYQMQKEKEKVLTHPSLEKLRKMLSRQSSELDSDIKRTQDKTYKY